MRKSATQLNAELNVALNVVDNQRKTIEKYDERDKDQISSLEIMRSTLAEEVNARGDAEKRFREQRSRADEAAKKMLETQSQFNDLKTRLLASERTAEFMRGYIARIQEDDVVQEPLVEVGEPGGECQFVPKRKATSIPRADDFTHPQDFSMRDGTYISSSEREERRKPKHWITY